MCIRDRFSSVHIGEGNGVMGEEMEDVQVNVESDFKLRKLDIGWECQVKVVVNLRGLLKNFGDNLMKFQLFCTRFVHISAYCAIYMNIFLFSCFFIFRITVLCHCCTDYLVGMVPVTNNSE